MVISFVEGKNGNEFNFLKAIGFWVAGEAFCKTVKKPDEKECFWHPP